MYLQSSEVNEIKYGWKFTVFEHTKLNAMIREVSSDLLEAAQWTYSAKAAKQKR